MKVVGVFINSQNREKIEKAIKECISIWNTEYGICEIHMKDLINRQNECSALPDDIPLVITKILSDWFSKLELPYIVQTCTNKTFEENRIPFKGKIDNFNFDKAEDQALFLLFIRLRMFMDQFYPDEEIEIVMDEGRRKADTVEKFKILESYTFDSSIKYASSRKFVLLQIADFFAYSLNRTQMTIVKDNKSESDELLYKYFTQLLTNQYSIGIAAIESNINNFTKDDYDYFQLMQRQIDGNLKSWKANNDE